MSENAAYGTDQSQPVYSPYSPFSPASEKSLYNTVDNTKFYQKIVAESLKRLENDYELSIEKKNWMDIKASNTRQLYSLRKAVNGLANTPAQKESAKKFILALEELNLSATLKNQAKAKTAWEAAKAELASFAASTK